MYKQWARRLAGRRAWLAGAAALGVVAVASWPGFSSGEVGASHHRESPLVSGDPKVDHTDLYAFVSPDKPDTVTLIASWLPFEQPSGGPEFYAFATDASYDIHIDNNGDGKADITYRWTFRDAGRGADPRVGQQRVHPGDVDPGGKARSQRYTLTAISPQRSTVLVADGTVAPPRADAAATSDYALTRERAVATIPGGLAFAGQADDPFFFDRRGFDALYGETPSGSGDDTMAGYNVQTVALQVPKAALALRGDPGRNPVVGVWSTTSKRTLTFTRGGPDGDMVQVSRLGNPLFTEMIGAPDLRDSFRTSTPDRDSRHDALIQRVADPATAKRVAGSYRVPAPPAPRHDLVELFLTGIAAQAPTVDGSPAPLRADLTAHLLNSDTDRTAIRLAEELRLNMAVPVTATPHRLGMLAKDFQGFPNGRRLSDDIVDIELQALAGATQTGQLVPALEPGDRVDRNDVPYATRFPYVALPNTTAHRASAEPAAGSGAGAGAPPAGDGWLSRAAGFGAFALLAGGLAAGWRYSRTTPGRYAVSR